MKRSLLGSMYLFCAMVGILTGYGIVTLISAKENIEHTKDNTLIRGTEDSVFFIGKNEKIEQMESLITPTQKSMDFSEIQETPFSEEDFMDQTLGTSETFSMEQKSGTLEIPSATQKPNLSEVISSSQSISLPNLPSTIQKQDSLENIATLTLAPIEVSTATQELSETLSKPTQTVTSDAPKMTEKNTDISKGTLPSLGVQWASAGQKVPQPALPMVTPKLQEVPAAEVITYPMQIFGQVPVINRSDTYVSYFEFSYDLIAILEPIANDRGLDINALLAKFAIKALLCGVDIEKLDINAPMPRRLAALCLWLTAQILNESDADASYKRAESYVTDIAGCSASEKKAIAYLYESGILKGNSVSGQCFCPQEGLKTEDGNAWLTEIKQRWN